MAKLTFVGGIHPYDGKDLSKDKPIQDVLPKGEMVYPLSQHIGAPAKPIVAKGDRVLAGQKIAESGGFVSAPIYASVSGTVKTIETRRVVTGDLIQSIVIDNDGLYDFTLEEIDACGLHIAEQTRDLHSSDFASRYTTTEYEDRFRGTGKNINYVRIEPPDL